MSFSLITSGGAALPIFTLTPDALRQKEQALAGSSGISKVTNAAENDLAIEAMKPLKALGVLFERERKKTKEPLLEAGRQLDGAVNTQQEELERELGRLECLIKSFSLAEQRRVHEEQEARRGELERIEREKQAALEDIRREQKRAEGRARAARKAAEQALRDAKDKAASRAAEKARREAVKRFRMAGRHAAAERRRVENEVAAQARIISCPHEVPRSAGQQNRRTWVIKQINDFQLLKARPDLIRHVEWDIIAIKEVLNSGGTLPGVVAEKDLRVSVRGANAGTIEV